MADPATFKEAPATETTSLTQRSSATKTEYGVVPEKSNKAEGKKLPGLPASAWVALSESDDICPNREEHHPFLDITRICCVFLVAVDHGAPEYGMWNVFFAQSWVLQFLFLVSGVCYGMSKRPLSEYLARLAIYAVVGVCVNWSAWLLMGLDWKSDFFNVVFHIWFVVGLMIYAILLWPLRKYLENTRRAFDKEEEEAAAAAAAAAAQRSTDIEASGTVAAPLGEGVPEMSVEERAQQRDKLMKTIVIVGGGVLGLLVLFREVMQPLFHLGTPTVLRLVKFLGPGTVFWGMPQNSEEAYDFLQRISSYTMLTLTNIYLIFVCPSVLRRRQLTAWAVYLVTYSHRLLFYRGNDERLWHGFDLMMLGMVVYYLGIMHRRILGLYIARYWFVVLLLCGLIWPLGMHARLDETPPPPQDLALRMEENVLEAIFVIVWLCAGERLVQKEIFTEDRLLFLNDWSLIVFLVHKAVHIMLPVPLNWVVIVGLAPACYLRRHYL